MQIDTEAVFKKLKKQNGEAVAKLIRDKHLDTIPNIVHILEFAGRNADDVGALVDGLREKYLKPIVSEYETNLTPIELLDLAGYDAYVVETEEDKNAIKKYFRPHEELCTFRDPTRHINNYIINAVRRGAENIKPSEHPERQDEYGTSVISIQISKNGGYISIKNRYNHSVKKQNPDATFNNNPDNIIPGLTNSLKKFFNVEFGTTNAEIPSNYHVIHDQYLRYNYEVENTYFGADYYSKGSDITRLNPNCQYMIDYFIWDAQEKKLLNPANKPNDSTYEVLKKLLEGKNVRIENNPVYKNEKIFYADGVQVAHTIDGKIRGLNLVEVRKVGDNFLDRNETIKKIELPDLETAGKCFLNGAEELTEFNAPKLRELGSWSLNTATNLEKFDAPKLQHVGNGFLNQNTELTELDLPELETVGNSFLCHNEKLTKLNAPKLQTVGDEFLRSNHNIETLDLPSLEKVDGFGFLGNNQILKSINLPRLKSVSDDFLRENLELTELVLPALTHTGRNFVVNNEKIKRFYAPNLKTVGDNFLMSNKGLRELSLPKLKYVLYGFFLYENTDLEKIYIPELDSVGISFLGNNTKMTEFDAPKLRQAEGPLFLMNHVLRKVNVPRLDPVRRNELTARVIRNAAQKFPVREVAPETKPQPKLDLTTDEFFAEWDKYLGGNSGNAPV